MFSSADLVLAHAYPVDTTHYFRGTTTSAVFDTTHVGSVVVGTVVTDESDLKQGNTSYSVIGTPVNDKRARPEDHPYYTTWYPTYYAPGAVYVGGIYSGGGGYVTTLPTWGN